MDSFQRTCHNQGILSKRRIICIEPMLSILQGERQFAFKCSFSSYCLLISNNAQYAESWTCLQDFERKAAATALLWCSERNRESSIVPDSVCLAYNEMCENLITPVQYNFHLSTQWVDNIYGQADS